MSLIILIYLIIMSKDDRVYTSVFFQGVSSFLPNIIIILMVISYFAKNKLTTNGRPKYEKKLRKEVPQALIVKMNQPNFYLKSKYQKYKHRTAHLCIKARI